MGPVELLIIAAINAVVIGVPAVFLGRAWARRTEARRAGGTPIAVAERLERIEQAVDTIAVEVERISEAQRFSAKALAERSASPRHRTRGEER